MNWIRGRFQRLTDGVRRLMPTGHGNHFADTMFPHMQERHLANGTNGAYQRYAGTRPSGAGGPKAPPSPMQIQMAIDTLRRAGFSEEAMSASERLMGGDF